ncbi:hypothetical protein KCU99_g7, partial [Aureobasidium melanogenum]
MASFVFRLAICSVLGIGPATAEDLDDDDFFLRFFSMPAFLAPLSLRPPPADVYSDDGMAGVKEVAMEGGSRYISDE